MIRVLIVDDSPEDAEFLKCLINDGQAEYSVVTALDGADAKRGVSMHNPDCILLDYRLEYESGLDVLPSLLRVCPTCPIIMLTGQGSEAIATDALKAGAADYLVKQNATGMFLRRAIRNAMERSRLRAQLAEREEDVRRQGRLEALGELSAGIAHDFNNMLAIIRFGVEGVAQGEIPEKDSKRLDIVLTAVDRAAERTQSLLAFASKQSGLLASLPCSRVLSEAAGLAAPPTEGIAQVEFEGPDPDPSVFCDQSMLQNALLNLVINARDAILACGRSGVITVSAQQVTCEENNQQIEFSVADNGDGIPPDIVDRVTDPYFTTKQDAGGTGIGLAMVHGFAQQNDSTVRISSDETGTVVSFRVPMSQADATRVAQNNTDPDQTKPPRRVLLVEDQEALAVLVAQDLTEAGFDVTVAHSAEAAISKLDDLTDQDAVVTDIYLGSGLDGFELAAKVRERFDNIKIIGMSGYCSSAQTEPANAIDKILIKPFRVSTLVANLCKPAA